MRREPILLIYSVVCPHSSIEVFAEYRALFLDRFDPLPDNCWTVLSNSVEFDQFLCLVTNYCTRLLHHLWRRIF